MPSNNDIANLAKRAKPKKGGSKPGERRGGRQVGGLNKETLRRIEMEKQSRAEVMAATRTELLANGPRPDVIRNMNPIEVMEYAMYLRAAAGDWDGAADRARDIAPYRQPRLSSQTV